MNSESTVMADSIVGRIGSLKSCWLSYGVHGSHGLREVLNGNILGTALGTLVGAFFHFFANDERTHGARKEDL
jgi:hypothetical protein